MNDVTDVQVTDGQEQKPDHVVDGVAEAEAQQDPGWFYAAGENPVKGYGEKPEWLADKYESVEAQAQAYPELAKKFGSFTGAPDEYSMEWAGDNDYSEGIEEVFSMAKDMGMNQEGFETFGKWHLEQMNTLAEAMVGSVDTEKQALGENADHRIESVNRFMKANMDADTYEEASEKLTSADAVELMEIMIKSTAPKKLPSEGGENPSGMTETKLRELRYAKDENGNEKMEVDLEYRAYVEGLWKDYYGTGGKSHVVNI